jgi:preprotein translocase subunit SecB
MFSLNVPEEHLQPILLIEAPRLLFPFARAIIAEVTSGGGLPPLMMQPIDFAALYRARLEQLSQVETSGTA